MGVALMNRRAIENAMQGLTLSGFSSLLAVETPTVIASANGQADAAPTSPPPWETREAVMAGWPLRSNFVRRR